MKPVEIVIETRRIGGGYRASVIEGPAWARGWETDSTSGADTPQVLYTWLRGELTAAAGRSGITGLDFMHVEA